MAINITGHRFPNASFARHGILLAPLTRHFQAMWGAHFVPDRQSLKVSTPKGTEYRLYPNVNGSHSDPHIVYYMARNVDTGLIEFMVGGFNWPDIFALYADDYANLALDFFTYSGITGEEADYEISSKLVGWLAMHGEFGEALSTVGDSWYQAVTSKEFWLTTVFSMVTRGVFKAALRTPNVPTSGSGGPPALPPGAGNTIRRSPPPPPTPVKTSRAPIHQNQPPSAGAGRTQTMSAAQIRLLRTADDILHQEPIRTSHVLQQPTVFRLVANSENAVPVRFVGTNVPAEMLEKMTKFIGESD